MRFFLGEMKMEQPILVTGGAGYIGSHTCKALAKAGYTPIVLDDLSTGYRHNVKWGPLEVADVSNKDRVRQIIRKYKPIAAMHFAGSAYVGESMIDPGKYYRNNVVDTFALLEVLREENVQILVFSSTCATYGLPEYLPLDVAHPQKPISPYGFSKYVSEQMIIEYGRVHNFKFGLLRYFNAAGGDEEGELKEEHCPETHLIPLALASAFGVGARLQVFGTDYPTPDGTCIRDYIHVSSLADAHVQTLNRLLDGETRALIRNLGSGCGYSVMEVISAIERVTGYAVEVEYSDRRLGDPPQLWAKTDEDFESLIGANNLDRIVLSASLGFRN
jgi:UDP-arabinose 4-epimerase